MLYLRLYALAALPLVSALALFGCGGAAPSVSSPAESSQSATENAAPVLETDFENVQLDEGLFFKLELAGHFSDDGCFVIGVEQTGQLQLPDWLHLNSSRNLLYGVPGNSDAGDIGIRVTATDEESTATSASFTISVSPAGSHLTEGEIAADENYVNELLLKESRFLAAGVGVNEVTALTHDGIGIDRGSLQLSGEPRVWSAASKESLHISILAKAILGDINAQRLIAGDDMENATELALDMLDRKMTTYETFDREYPAFGGFLPWFSSEDRGEGTKVYPRAEWSDRFPALDNGQLAWSIYLVYNALSKMGFNELAARYEARFSQMADNAKTLFFGPAGNSIAGISRFEDADGQPDSSLPPEELRYIKDSYLLTDSFEGELMVAFMTLFCPDLSPMKNRRYGRINLSIHARIPAQRISH